MPIYDTAHPVAPQAPAPGPGLPAVKDTASVYTNFNHQTTVVGPIDGTPWILPAYYAQFLGATDPIVNANDILNPTLKQYLKINNFEIRVTQALTSSLDPATSTAVVTGSANMYPVQQPTPGDIFIGMTEPGIYGVFEITAINRLSMYQQSAWSITYSQIDYLTPALQTQYDSFVVAELVFDSSLIGTTINPLQSITEYARTQQKELLIGELISEYYTKFYDNDFETFLFRNDQAFGLVYDPFLIEFWQKYVDHSLYTGTPVPRAYNYKNNIVNKPFLTVFDLIDKQSNNLLGSCVKTMDTRLSIDFAGGYLRQTFATSGIDLIIFPFDTQDRTADLTLRGPNNLPNPYILSEAFYTQSIGQTAMDGLITKLITRQAVTYTELLPLIVNRSQLTDQVAFYYIPLFLLLLQVAR